MLGRVFDLPDGLRLVVRGWWARPQDHLPSRRGVTLFEVGLTMSWSFIDGSSFESVEDDTQSITLDLAYGPPAYMAGCPMVELEILTPPA